MNVFSIKKKKTIQIDKEIICSILIYELYNKNEETLDDEFITIVFIKYSKINLIRVFYYSSNEL